MSQGYSGVHANVRVGANDVDAMGWTADYEANTWDSTTTADGGWDATSTSTLKFSGTFDVLYNKTKKPFGTLALNPGTLFSGQFFITSVDGDVLTGQGTITKASIKAKIREGIIITISFVNNGPWVLPS